MLTELVARGYSGTEFDSLLGSDDGATSDDIGGYGVLMIKNYNIFFLYNLIIYKQNKGFIISFIGAIVTKNYTYKGHYFVTKWVPPFGHFVDLL